MDAWIASMGLSGSFHRSQGGSFIEANWINPGSVFTGSARIMILDIDANRLTSIVADVPISRKPVDELRDLVTLLGLPDHILLELIQGDFSLGYALRLGYRTRGLEVSFFGDVNELTVNGQAKDTICLGSSPSREVTVVLSPYLSDDAFSQWADQIGVEEAQLIDWLLEPSRCVPIYP